MNVFCIIKNDNGNKTLEFVFEKHSRAFASLERLKEQIRKDQENLTYSLIEMYVYKGEESKQRKDI